MAASGAAIAARATTLLSSSPPSTAPRSSSIPAAGTAASPIYASASSAGCNGAAKRAGSPLRKTGGSVAAALPLLPQGEGGGCSPPDEGARATLRRGRTSRANPHPQPLSRWRGGLAGCNCAATPAGSPLRKTVGSAAAALPLLPPGEGGGRSPTDEGAAATNPHPQTLSRWRGGPRR